MIRYAVTKGRPDTGETCTVMATEGGETIAYYTGYFDRYRREWKLTLNKPESYRKLDKRLRLGEREVHYEVRPAMMPRKTNIQRKPAETEKPRPAEQIKLM